MNLSLKSKIGHQSYDRKVQHNLSLNFLQSDKIEKQVKFWKKKCLFCISKIKFENGFIFTVSNHSLSYFIFQARKWNIFKFLPHWFN